MKFPKLLLSITLVLWFNALFAQIDHYETIFYDSDLWQYRAADSEPASNWMQANFDDTAWNTGPGGFGYGDGDDAIQVESNNGVYLRKQFEVVDIAAIEELILDADYDDGFVAYLNGVELARALIQGNPPPYNATVDGDHEAALYQGGLPERFTFLPADFENILQEGTNTLAIQVANFGEDSSDMTARFFLSVAVNQSDFTYNQVPDWFPLPPVHVTFESSNLPLLFINTNNGEEIPDEPRIVAQMGIIDNGAGQRNFLTDTYNDYDGRIEVELRGSSSLFFFDKKNYRIETQTELGDNNNVSLLGMPQENDWVLHGPFSDKSLMRNVLSFHLGELTGQWVPRTRWCELMINDEYRGVYVLMENIKRDENRLDIATVKPEDVEGDELTGGYAFRIDRDNENSKIDGWYAFNGNYPYFYGIIEPHYNDIVPVQRSYLQNHINTFEEAILSPTYLDKYEDYVEVSSLVDYFLVNEIAKHVDAFKLSFFMYKEKDSKGGKIHFGPLWDFNLGYGNFDFECDNSPEGWIYNCTSVTHWFNRLVEITEVKDEMYCRWQELRSGPYQTDNLMAFIDEQAALLEEAQVRNFARFDILNEHVWPNTFIGGTYENEINFLKNFLLLRLQWMDGAIQPSTMLNCEAILPTDDLQQKLQVAIFPNPMTDYVQFNYESNRYPVANLRIYTTNGVLIHQEKIIQGQLNKINTQQWQQGSYIYNISIRDKILNFGQIVK